jgi:hypothetical protein
MKGRSEGFFTGACIVSPMFPLASASGPAIIGIVVVGSGLFLWWLLRQDANDEQSERAAEDDRKPPERH